MRTLFLMVLATSVAQANEPLMVHSARILDTAGQPMEGSVQIVVELLDANSVVVWDEPHTVTAENGYIAVHLGTIETLTAAEVERATQIQLSANTVPLLAPQPIASVPRAVVTDGVVILSAEPACETSTQGALRWTGEALEVCHESAWVGVGSAASTTPSGLSQEDAAPSCLAIKQDVPAAGSGPYWIDPDGGSTADAYRLWCDMDTDGGGWALIASTQQGTGSLPGGSSALNSGLLDDGLEPVGNARISDEDANLLGAEFRHVVGSRGQYVRFYLLTNAIHLGESSGLTTQDQCKASYNASYQNLSFQPRSEILALGSDNNGSGSNDACGGGSSTGSWFSWRPNGSSNGSYSQSTGYTNGWIYVR